MAGNVRVGVRATYFAALVLGLATGPAALSAFASDCPRPDTLGTSRTLVVDAKEHPLIDANYLATRQDLDTRIAQLNAELATLKAERSRWERRVSLLQPESIDPDMLDERARALLDYVDPNDLTLQVARP